MITDIRQDRRWGNYMEKIGWSIEWAGKTQVFIRPVPFINRSVIKIQRPDNPLDLEKIDLIAKKHRALFILIEPQYIKYDPEKFKTYGYIISRMMMGHTSTIQINLNKSELQLYRSLSENARRNIKKAQDIGVIVQTVPLKNQKDDREFRRFFDLLKNLTNIKKFYIPQYQEFYDKMRAFKDSSTLFFAYDNSIPIAAIWTAYFQDTVWYFQTGITDEGYQKLANYLLVWEAMRYHQKLGIKNWDFEGIYDHRFPKEHPRWKNFTEFKKRFHGDIILYPPSWIKIYSPWFKIIYYLSNILP